MQVGSDNRPLPEAPPPAERPPQATGFLAGIGRRAFGWALAHEAPPTLDGKSFSAVHPQCGTLIQDISAQVIKTLLKETKNSAIVAGGSDQLQTTIVELAELIFISLGASDNADMSDDEFVDHVLATIIQTVRQEFAKEGTPREHFIRIADTLFEKAFPDGVNDPRLPKLLKEDRASRLARYAIFKAKGIDLSWAGIKGLFATYLEQTYTAFTAGQGATLSKEGLPGANELIDAVVAKIDSKTKETKALALEIPLENEGAKNFVNGALLRLLKGQFIQEADTGELQAARTWLLDNIKSSVKAVYQALFAPNQGQTEGERLNQFAENLLVRICEVLPQLEKSEDAEKAVRKILQDELKPEKLQPLLPNFLSAETVCNKIYSSLAPLLVDIMAQSAVIQKRGNEAQAALTSQEGGKKIADLMDQGLAKIWDLLQVKAQAQTLESTPYKFINNLLGHVLLPSTLAKVPEVKTYINAQLKNIVSIVLKEAIGPEGMKNPEKAIADLMNKIITEAQAEVEALLDGEEDDVDAKLLEASKKILSNVVTAEQLNELLPKFLKKSDLWTTCAEALRDNLLKGLYTQAKQIQNMSGPAFVLPAELKPHLDVLNTKIVAALENPGEQTLLAAFLRGPGVVNLVKTALPKILEALVSYHVHPVEGKTSEERTAELVVYFATSLMDGFDAVQKAPKYEEWVKGIDPKLLAQYRKEHNIPRDHPVDVRAYILRERSRNLVAKLFPKELQEALLPKEFAAFKLDKLLEELCYEYMNKAYDYSTIVTKVEGEDKDLKGLQKYMIEQIGGYFANIKEDKRTWFDNVARAVFAGKNDKVLGFLLNFGALGVVLDNAQGEQSGLVVTLAPIIDIARKVFANIDNVDALLTPSVEEIAAFEAATKKTHANDKKEFAYWLLARRALDIVSDDQWKKAVPIVKKEAAATLLMKLYETAHATQAVLKNKSASGANEVQKQKDLTQFVDTYFVKNIQELLVQLGSTAEPLAKTLPVILDTLIKQSLAESGVIGEARNSALEQVIYTVMGKLLTDSKTPVEKVREIVASYNEGNNEAVARMLLKEALPEELAATPLGRVLVNEAAPIAIGILLNDIRASQKVIQQKGEEAKSYVNRIDEYSMKPFVEGMLQALDGTLDEMAHDPKKLSEMLPDYMDGLIKGVFKDSALMPIIKEASHTAIYIVLQQVLTPKEGQSIQDRVAEVAAELIAIYDSNNPKESAAKWLKLLLPEATLKALLPEFLKKSITHEKLVEWFFEPYAKQIVNVTKAMHAENAIKPSDNVAKAQKFVQSQLQGTDLLGFGGVVADIQKKLLDPTALPEMQSYLNAAVGHVTRTLEKQQLLDPRFLSNALIAALPSMETPIDGMPDDIAPLATEKLLAKLFPGGQAELPIPEVAQAAVWKKLTEAIQGLFTDLTTADRRTLFILDRLIPLATDDQNKIKTDLKKVNELRSRLLAGSLSSQDRKEVEKLFKKAFVQTAVHQVDVAIKKEKLWGPFKWIKAVVVKAVTYLVVRFNFQNRIYNFISNKENDEKFRRLIWSLVTYTPTTLADDTQEELKKQLKTTLKSTNTAPPLLRGILAKYIGEGLNNKNILDLI